MYRVLSASWGLLLAVLLGITPRAGVSFEAAAGGIVLRPATASGALEAHYLRTVARAQAAVETRSPPERQSSTPGAVLRGEAALALAVSLERAQRTHRHAPPPVHQARGFPLFPTGPPSSS